MAASRGHFLVVFAAYFIAVHDGDVAAVFRRWLAAGSGASNQLCSSLAKGFCETGPAERVLREPDIAKPA
jgi:hypothetical protein